MKTLAINTFNSFEHEMTINSEAELQSLVNSFNIESFNELFIVIFTTAYDNYVGFAFITPRSGDLVQAHTMVEMASQHYANGAIVLHHITSPSSLKLECRIMAEIDNTLAENSIDLYDYYTLKEGKFTSFSDTMI